MRQSFPPGRLGPAVLAALVSLSLLVACGDDGNDSDINTPVQGSGKLSLACPGNVAAGVKIVNGFSASLISSTGAPVANTFIGISPTPNQGSVYAPATSSSATFGGNTDANGQLTLGFTAPASATNGTVYQLVAKSGSQTTSCQVTVQTPSLVFTAPSNSSVYNTCTAQRLRVSSTANGDSTVKVASTVDLTANNGAFFTSNPNPSSCTTSSGSSSLTGIGISGSTGDFQNPIYIVGTAVGSATVTATDENTDGRSASVNVQFTDTPDTLLLQAQSTTVAPSGSLNLTATVYDGRQTIGNYEVDFVQPSDGSRIIPSMPVTDSKTGVATTTFRAGTTPGTVQVRACAYGSSTACDQITITIKAS